MSIRIKSIIASKLFLINFVTGCIFSDKSLEVDSVSEKEKGE